LHVADVGSHLPRACVCDQFVGATFEKMPLFLLAIVIVLAASPLFILFFMMCYMALKCCHYRRLRMRLYNNRQGGENDYDNLQP